MNEQARDHDIVWLDLLPGHPLASHAVESGVQIVAGTRDRFPEEPGGYERIFLLMDEDWVRWQRWYFQCFSRQLRPGGWLHLCLADGSKRQAASLLKRVRQKASKIRWQLAGNVASPSLAKRLIPSSLQALAAAHRLQLDAEPDSERDLPPSVCFRKNAPANKNDYIINSEMVTAEFNHHFADWIDTIGVTPGPDNVNHSTAKDLLAARSSETVLVLSPHPDDELIGCGGTLLLLQEAGASIHVVQMTEGATCRALRNASEHEKRSIRWEEAGAVANDLGFHSHFWPTGADGALVDDAATVVRLRKLLDELKPELVFAPASTDRHYEHRLARQILGKASDSIPPGTQILEYPVWGFLPKPTHAVEVTSTHARILESLYRYRTAMKAEDYVSRCRVMSQYHANRLLGNTSMAVEQFSEVQISKLRSDSRSQNMQA